MGGTQLPPCSMVMGVPGRVVRKVGPASIDANRAVSAHYIEYARSYREKPG